MADPTHLSNEELARQARQHLESLRHAGVDWLPTAPLPEAPPAASSPHPAAASAPGPALFADDLFASPPAAAPTVPIEERRQALKMLAEQVAGCMRCPAL